MVGWLSLGEISALLEGLTAAEIQPMCCELGLVSGVGVARRCWELKRVGVGHCPGRFSRFPARKLRQKKSYSVFCF